jgi:hypothetical protein
MLPRIKHFPSTLFSHALSLSSSLSVRTNFHTHIQQAKLYEISGFRCEADENCGLLGYYHYSLRNNPEERSSQQAKL